MTASIKQMACFVSLLCLPCLVGAAEVPKANRWEAKSHNENLTALERQAYEQLAELQGFEGRQMDNWGNVDYPVMPSEGNPMKALHNMGISVLPTLAEALDDGTPTKTVTRVGRPSERRGSPHLWKVNELVALLIRDITNHEFVLGEWRSEVNLRDIESHRDLISQFQKEILRWYKENKDRTQEERMIANLDSSPHNRLDAERWLGTKKSIKAVPFLVNRIDGILDERESSLTETELAEVSLALGRIGDPKGLPAVKKACDHLSIRLPRSPGSAAVRDLFSAYHGLALLGQKKEALAESNRIYKEASPRMEPLRKKEFEERLAEAAKW
jgi:hypothetical protein